MQNKKEHKGTENLIPTTERSEEEVKNMQRKGGINSGITRRKQKTMRETFRTLMGVAMTDGKGGTMTSPLTGDEMTVAEAIATATIKQAVQGDPRAVRIITDVLGENVININSSVERLSPEEARRQLRVAGVLRHTNREPHGRAVRHHRHQGRRS